METEKLLMESREDGAFLIRESDTVKGAYVLSTMWVDNLKIYIPTSVRVHIDNCIMETVAEVKTGGFGKWAIIKVWLFQWYCTSGKFQVIIGAPL